MAEETKESRYPAELSDENLEYIYIGLLLNNPKAISMYYFLYEDFHFTDLELADIYKSILFQEAEKYAPAIAKENYNIPREKANTYATKEEIKRVVGEKNYNIEFIYTELKKLFILKKHYIVAATKTIRDKILEVQNYKLYTEMTVEEVKNALDQIGVTAGLSQVVLNDDATNYLLAGDNNLSTGATIPFPILSKVFKGLRKGETMSYAMPSNSGKSRFTVNLMAHIAFVHHKKVLVISTGMGGPSTAICIEELALIGIENLIRVGTCGGMQMEVCAGDIVIAQAAIRQEGTSKEYVPIEYPAVADLKITNALVEATNELGLTSHVGVVQCKDSFYGQHSPEKMPVSYELENKWNAWIKAGALASEMETASLYIVASTLRLKAGAVLSAVWNQEREAAGLPQETNLDVDNEIKVAVKAVEKLIKGE